MEHRGTCRPAAARHRRLLRASSRLLPGRRRPRSRWPPPPKSRLPNGAPMHSAVPVIRMGPPGRVPVKNCPQTSTHGAYLCTDGERTPGLDASRTMGVMAILPSPSALIELGRHAFGQILESAASLTTVPVRMIGVLSQAALLVSRLTVIAEQAEALVPRVAA